MEKEYKEYLISFSSFYKAAYAQEKLAKEGFSASLRKLPTELIRSCGTGLYLRTAHIQDAMEIFQRNSIIPRGVFEIRSGGRNGREYVKVI
jgi:hypothetical protein